MVSDIKGALMALSMEWSIVGGLEEVLVFLLLFVLLLTLLVGVVAVGNNEP